jgi:Trypsin
MRRAVLLLATMALAILAASGVAQAIINGQPDGNRHPYVGWASTEEWACSGTLISPTVFLTAGHCTELFEEGDSQVYVTFEPEADFFPVELDPDGVFDPGDAHTGTAHTHPSWDGFVYDVGVVILDEPVRMAQYGRLPTANLVETLDMGDPLTMVGYGVRDYEVGGGPPRPTDFGIRYRATVEFKGTNGLPIQYFGRNLHFRFSGASMGEGREGGCFGDSGGPLFMPNQKTVLGVYALLNNQVCAGSGYAQRVDLPEVLSWVRSFL